jgi:hypothetical protein
MILGTIVRKTWEQRTAFMEAWKMTILQIEIEEARPIGVECDDRSLTVRLADGRVLQAPLWWYPRLLAATPDDRARFEMSPLGLHWPGIDEDISIASILRGTKAPRP